MTPSFPVNMESNKEYDDEPRGQELQISQDDLDIDDDELEKENAESKVKKQE